MKKKEDKVYFSFLARSRGTLWSFSVFCFFMFGLFTVVLFQAMRIQASWGTMAMSVSTMGFWLVVYPLIESWAYQPWQAKAQKYERHYRDKL